MNLTIREYLSPEGRNPFRDWLDALDVSMRARIQARVLRFETGNLGDHKTVGGGVWEARLPFGPGYRIYFGKDRGVIILLLLGGDKASQRKDIRKRRSSGSSTWRRRRMARRTNDWNTGLTRDLRDPEFARRFLLAAIEEGIPLQHALGKAIRAMGVKEFAARVRMASPNLVRVINPKHNPTQDTLNRLLRPFRLKLSLTRLDSPKGRHVA